MTEEGIEEVAYCGLHCEGCFSYKGTIADMARDLRKELRGYALLLFMMVFN
ncbi:MAG: hypothetical protein SVY15_08845 [Halobacteriota archaeon]|nr:hypothetical protein [Halobacteriota archaeon]